MVDMQMRCELAHQVVVFEVVRMHLLDAEVLRGHDQVFHQQRSESLVLPRIADDHGELAVLALRLRAESRYAHFNLSCACLDHRDIRHVGQRVDRRELLKQLVTR